VKILVIGGGGREHAILWKLALSPRRPKLFVAPGNPGMAKLARLVPIPVQAKEILVNFAIRERIDLTICGPEAPLCDGLADLFFQHNIPFVGPSRLAAMLEGSKCYAKAVMTQFNIPTADYRVFRDATAAREYLKNASYPVVIKADGLCAGKGVFLPVDYEEASAAVDDLLVKQVFGAAGQAILVEEHLRGTEASFLCFTDGLVAYPMATASDYKRIGEGDTGPNTGGMGAYSPNPLIDDAKRTEVMDRVVNPLIRGLHARGIAFRGILYVGLMMTADGMRVLEFNVRFGDPETQVILPRLKNDLVDVLMAIADERLSDVHLTWDRRPALAVVMASRGYPGRAEVGAPIKGLPDADDSDAMVFHAGTDLKDDQLVTAAGRVLSITALGETLAMARRKVYDVVSRVQFDGMQFRKDIGEGVS
jgi:phosphoribosylamine--glycine ligase